MGGLMNLCGHPGRAPLMGPCDVAYHLGSVHAAFGTLVALFNRRLTGFGDHVEVSLQDVLVADPFLRIITRHSVTGEIPGAHRPQPIDDRRRNLPMPRRLRAHLRQSAGPLEAVYRMARPPA